MYHSMPIMTIKTLFLCFLEVNSRAKSIITINITTTKITVYQIHIMQSNASPWIII